MSDPWKDSPQNNDTEKQISDNSVAEEPTTTRQEMRRMICDIEESVVEDFLLLIRNNYGRADKAMFFLEQRSGILNLQAITNVRDVLSHLATMLNPKLTEEQRNEQLGNIEEHLRRAIIEPYEIALSDAMEKFSKMHGDYKRLVLPIKTDHTALQHAPNAVSIEASLREIGTLTAKGRTGKGKNLWNTEWEEGVTSFVDAFDKLSALHIELEGYLFKAQQIERETGEHRKIESLQSEVISLRSQVKGESTLSTILHFGGYVLAVLFFLVAAVLAIFPSLAEGIRKILHLE